MSQFHSQNHFERFQLPAQFQLDTGELERRYRDIQARIHPDKAAHLGETEKRLSLQWATLINEAYQTLKIPLDRARYLVSLNGSPCNEESNTAMPAEFLLEQIEWRSELQEASALRHQERLERLEGILQREMADLYRLLANLLDVERNFPAAADIVRQLAFLDKLDRDIGQALTELED